MIALDTNIVVRLLVRDNEQQYEVARRLLDQECLLEWTVVLEAGWVLDARYDWPRDVIVDGFRDLMAIATIVVPNESAMHWAIDRFAEGADFADMVHLASCNPAAEAFVSFDRRLARQAGAQAPIAVRLAQ